MLLPGITPERLKLLRRASENHEQSQAEGLGGSLLWGFCFRNNKEQK